jgi:cbb3-type cytochrome oxidase subunit 3
MIVVAEGSTAYVLVFWGIIAVLVYAYYRYSKKDVDYSTIFAEIPPE